MRQAGTHQPGSLVQQRLLGGGERVTRGRAGRRGARRAGGSATRRRRAHTRARKPRGGARGPDVTLPAAGHSSSARATLPAQRVSSSRPFSLRRLRPNNTFGFLVPEATFCREYAQNQVSGTRFCHFSRDRHTPEPPRYRAFCGFLAPDTCISSLFTAPSCLSARSCPVPDGGGCSRRVWVGPWSLW